MPRRGLVAVTPALCRGFRAALSLRLLVFQRLGGPACPAPRGRPRPARPPRPERSCAARRRALCSSLFPKWALPLVPSQLSEAVGWVTEMQTFDLLSLKFPQGPWSGVWE